MKLSWRSGLFAAALLSCFGTAAGANENWFSSLEKLPSFGLDEDSRAAANGPVWSGNVTFATVAAACKSPTSFKAGDVRKGFFRPFQKGQFLPAAMIVFPDGLWLGVARSTTLYGSIGINRSVWLFASPTDKNRWSVVTKPAKVTEATPKIDIDATFDYFYGVKGCTVRIKGSLKKG